MDNLSKGDKIYYPEMDIARGIAILLVVFAHCIQCGNGAEYYENLNFLIILFTNQYIRFICHY